MQNNNWCKKMTEKSSVFIKVDEYRKVLDTLDKLKKQVVDIKKTISSIEKLRADEEKELTSWSEKVNEIEQKILFVDSSLFEPEQ